jgi:hypothetical protein
MEDIQELAREFCKRCITLYARRVPQTSQEMEIVNNNPRDARFARRKYVSPSGHKSSYCLGCQSELSGSYQKIKRLLPLLTSKDGIPEHARPLLAEYLLKEVRKMLRYQAKPGAIAYLYERQRVLLGFPSVRNLTNNDKVEALFKAWPGFIDVDKDLLWVPDEDLVEYERQIEQHACFTLLAGLAL